MDMLADTGPGRRGIVLITSGDTAAKRGWLKDAADRAAESRIGIHVVCLGVKADDLRVVRANGKRDEGIEGHQ